MNNPDKKQLSVEEFLYLFDRAIDEKIIAHQEEEFRHPPLDTESMMNNAIYGCCLKFTKEYTRKVFDELKEKYNFE